METMLDSHPHGLGGFGGYGGAGGGDDEDPNEGPADDDVDQEEGQYPEPPSLQEGAEAEDQPGGTESPGEQE